MKTKSKLNTNMVYFLRKILEKIKYLGLYSELDLLRFNLAIANLIMGIWFVHGFEYSNIPQFNLLFSIFPQEMFGGFLILHSIVSIIFLITTLSHFFILLIGRIFCFSFWTTMTVIMIDIHQLRPDTVPIIMISMMSWWVLVRTTHDT